MKEERNILLESGTNELELLEFSIHNDKGEKIKLGLNVAKVREIIKTVDIRTLPDQHPSVMGIFELRGSNIQSLDIRHFLYNVNSQEPIFIIMEFSKMRMGMAVGNVDKITRVEWKHVKSFETITEAIDKKLVENLTGVYHNGKEHIYILDVERIVSEVRGEEILNTVEEDSSSSKMSGLILTAEDSTFLRKRITSELKKAGFEVSDHVDGLKAYEAINKIISNGEPLPDIIVTDVEMPEMDGYTLTRKIKENDITKHIPVIIFSSLITDDVIHKGESVGADRQLSKPDLNILIDMIRELL